jgi:hypothetical protein
MKRFIALILTLILALTLTACGEGGNIYQVGDIIRFGGYDWRVLDIQDGKALILSDKILTKRVYHMSSDSRITWAESEMREYLNSEFIDDIFTSKEKARIAEVSLENKGNQWFEMDDDIQTVDKVFLLSIEEVVRYFGDSGKLSNRPGDATYIDDMYNSARIAYTTDGTASMWWLRSPGATAIRRDTIVSHAAHVGPGGGLGITGFEFDYSGGVRPALWLNP